MYKAEVECGAVETNRAVFFIPASTLKFNLPIYPLLNQEGELQGGE